jgi:hypothetical protein
MPNSRLLSRKEALEYLKIPENYFNNYFNKSGEIKGFKRNNRFFFRKPLLDSWNNLRKKRTVFISLKSYTKCFEFAIKMAYSPNAKRFGIRGERSEVQMADDFILGILAEIGLKKILQKRFNCSITLDMRVHPDRITPQDVLAVKKSTGIRRSPKLCIAVKSSKMKSCFNIIAPAEYTKVDRKSDVYIFVRVGLPSDHLFMILRNHSFFKSAKDFLDRRKKFKKIVKLTNFPVWICGYSWHRELDKVKKIPGQDFNSYRYVKSVSEMHNSDEEWRDLIRTL